MPPRLSAIALDNNLIKRSKQAVVYTGYRIRLHSEAQQLFSELSGASFWRGTVAFDRVAKP